MSLTLTCDPLFLCNSCPTLTVPDAGLALRYDMWLTTFDPSLRDYKESTLLEFEGKISPGGLCLK
jgi:hypothetical protein